MCGCGVHFFLVCVSPFPPCVFFFLALAFQPLHFSRGSPSSPLFFVLSLKSPPLRNHSPLLNLSPSRLRFWTSFPPRQNPYSTTPPRSPCPFPSLPIWDDPLPLIEYFCRTLLRLPLASDRLLFFAFFSMSCQSSALDPYIPLPYLLFSSSYSSSFSLFSLSIFPPSQQPFLHRLPGNSTRRSPPVTRNPDLFFPAPPSVLSFLFFITLHLYKSPPHPPFFASDTPR